jgi:hypothetical protein
MFGITIMNSIHRHGLPQAGHPPLLKEGRRPNLYPSLSRNRFTTSPISPASRLAKANRK